MITTALILYLLESSCPAIDSINIIGKGKETNKHYREMLTTIIEGRQEAHERCAKFANYYPERNHLEIIWRAED